MARKLTVTHEGQTFTRKTDRVYTHVVLVRNSLPKLQERAARYAPMGKSDADYYRSMIDGTWGHSRTPNDTELATARKLVEMGLDAFNQERIAAAVLRTAKNFNPGWQVQGWCGRIDLAQKLRDSALRADYSVVADAVIVPVQQP